ncbi:MAG TPA: PepSY domain-containing protein [Gammaproteobacteria bacterium]
MKRNLLHVTACAAVAAAWLGAFGAEARPRPDVPAATVEDTPAPRARTVQRGELARGISLQEATAIALQRFPGRVVSAETVVQGGRQVHVIRIIGDGNRVRTVRIDAQTGQFM